MQMQMSPQNRNKGKKCFVENKKHEEVVRKSKDCDTDIEVICVKRNSKGYFLVIHFQDGDSESFTICVEDIPIEKNLYKFFKRIFEGVELEDA